MPPGVSVLGYAMEAFYILVALVQFVASPPFPIYDTFNRYPTEAACMKNTIDFGHAVSHAMRAYPVLSITVWCQRRIAHLEGKEA